MPFVLDASAALAWALDEGETVADQALDRLRNDDPVVPAIWPLEVANALLLGERRGRLSRGDTLRAAELLAALPVAVDHSSPARAFTSVMELGREYDLGAYDAAYLDLALRIAAPLLTLDRPLRRAASRAGVELL